MARVVIALLIIFALTLGANANERGRSYFFKSDALREKCSSSSRADREFCEAYIAGVVDAIGSRSDPNNDVKQVAKCDNKRVSLRQLRDAVVKILEEFPDQNVMASGVVVAAIGDYCEDPDKGEKIRAQLGLEPPRQTEEHAYWIRMYGCMYALESSKSECEELVSEAMKQ